mmetsp:Transcript_37836/g.36262  ORF Transcript_37836/g.36262 Transcript_37836/m.36262 type:complete len:130 (+) Transcript_37836:1569-1958(+)
MYIDPKTKKPQLIEYYYKVGKYAETGKKDTMTGDLDKKSQYILELLKEKEEIEGNLAGFGCIHHIYKTFIEIQEELKNDIKKFVREKHQINMHLETLLTEFEDLAESIGRQEGNLKTHRAKFKAIKYLL